VEIESAWTEYHRATNGSALAKTGLGRVNTN
jgi:hypothetical protein